MATTTTINSSSAINNRVNFREIEDEIVLFLRNNLTDRRSRAESGTETFTGDGSTTVFELTGDLDSNSRHKIMNVTQLTIDGVIKTFYSDYIVGFRKTSPILGKIQFWNPPANGEVISITYEKTYHFIYPELSRVDLKTKEYPRVFLQLANSTPTDVAIGGKVSKFDITVQITPVDLTRDNVELLVQEIKDLFTLESNKHGFHFFDYIHEPRITPLVQNGEDPNDVVYLQQIELTIPTLYEFSR